jgi:putative ABC transport system ATP-binding protein
MTKKSTLASSRETLNLETSFKGAPIAVVERASKIYGLAENKLIALNEVSLTIQAGQSVALIGRSGSGKSTLLNLLGAVDRPTSGSIIIDGTHLSKMTDGQLALFRRRRLGYVFQSFHLVPSLTVFDNVAVPWTLDRAMTAARKNEINDLLNRLGVADKSRRYPDELSGGQQQRVAVARAIVHRPALLLADEPTGNLDAQTGRVILDLLDDMRREFGITLVMATHSTEAAQRCDQRITLSDGRIVQQ